MRKDYQLPGNVIQAGGLGDQVMLVKRVAVRISDNFCSASMELNLFSKHWWVMVETEKVATDALLVAEEFKNI